MEDLFIKGKYEPRNKWNRDSKNGAMHLIMGANTLNAEIELAGGSSIVRLGPDGEYLQDDQVRQECACIFRCLSCHACAPSLGMQAATH